MLGPLRLGEGAAFMEAEKAFATGIFQKYFQERTQPAAALTLLPAAPVTVRVIVHHPIADSTGKCVRVLLPNPLRNARGTGLPAERC